MKDIYQHMKLESHFRDNTTVKEQTKEEIFKKTTNKKWASNKNHHSLNTL